VSIHFSCSPMASLFKKASKERPTSSHSKDKHNSNEDKTVKRKSKLLVLSTRGITYRHRHLMLDLEALLPHSKRDVKLDTKSSFEILTELCELHSCDTCLLFESRKKTDLYIWMAIMPNGPTVKLHVQNVHTTDELKMTGNCLKGSRPILSLSSNFEATAHGRLMSAILQRIFSVPKNTRKGKPFIDHVFNVDYIDGRLWFRNFQIVDKDPIAGDADTGMSLVEIGPRYVLQPMRIFAGAFNGQVVWENPDYLSPNKIRSMRMRSKAGTYRERKLNEEERVVRVKGLKGAEIDPVEQVFET